jgi:hypothetical protein
MTSKHLLRRRKTTVGQEKGLANLWSRKKITKTPHVGRELETKWEIPDQTDGDLEQGISYSFKLWTLKTS